MPIKVFWNKLCRQEAMEKQVLGSTLLSTYILIRRRSDSKRQYYITCPVWLAGAELTGSSGEVYLALPSISWRIWAALSSRYWQTASLVFSSSANLPSIVWKNTSSSFSKSHRDFRHYGIARIPYYNGYSPCHSWAAPKTTAWKNSLNRWRWPRIPWIRLRARMLLECCNQAIKRLIWARVLRKTWYDFSIASWISSFEKAGIFWRGGNSTSSAKLSTK